MQRCLAPGEVDRYLPERLDLLSTCSPHKLGCYHLSSSLEQSGIMEPCAFLREDASKLNVFWGAAGAILIEEGKYAEIVNFTMLCPPPQHPSNEVGGKINHNIYKLFPKT